MNAEVLLEAPAERLVPRYDGIFDLVDPVLLDSAAQNEIAVFDSLPIENVCYFRPSMMSAVMALVGPMMAQAGLPPVAVEIGGGEGYFARAFLDHAPLGIGIVADLSIRALGCADPRLVRVRCDVRRRYLQPCSVGLAAFWVSLHHFSTEDAARALAEASRALAPGGLLLVFEPNGDFLPRRWFLKSFLADQVYFDDEEKPLCWAEVTALAATQGLRPRVGTSVSPPYSLAFLRHFGAWPLFLLGTEALHRITGCRLPPLPEHDQPMVRGLTRGSYLLGLFQKD